LGVIENIPADSRERLTRLLDLFLDGAFLKVLLVERKNRLGTTLIQLEEERSKLLVEIDSGSLIQNQIRTIQEFVAQVVMELDKGDHDFSVPRRMIEILDVRDTPAVEDEEQILYANCVLGKEAYVLKIIFRVVLDKKRTV
jgi:hypothetical protein